MRTIIGTILDFLVLRLPSLSRSRASLTASAPARSVSLVSVARVEPRDPEVLAPEAGRMPSVAMPLVLSLLGHGFVLAGLALLPSQSYGVAPVSAELSFEVVEPVAPVLPPPPVALPEPEPAPVARAEVRRPPRPRPRRQAAPPPPAPVLAAAAAQPSSWEHPEGEPDGQLGGTPGGTGDTLGAELVEPVQAVEPARPTISRAELRRRLIDYIRTTLHAHVNQRISMPLLARREHLEGTVIVRLRLSRAGEILSARVSRSSGHGVLDDAALESIRGLATLPAPPADLPWDSDEELPLPVRYQLQ